MIFYILLIKIKIKKKKNKKKKKKFIFIRNIKKEGIFVIGKMDKHFNDPFLNQIKVINSEFINCSDIALLKFGNIEFDNCIILYYIIYLLYNLYNYNL